MSAASDESEFLRRPSSSQDTSYYIMLPAGTLTTEDDKARVEMVVPVRFSNSEVLDKVADALQSFNKTWEEEDHTMTVPSAGEYDETKMLTWARQKTLEFVTRMRDEIHQNETKFTVVSFVNPADADIVERATDRKAPKEWRPLRCRPLDVLVEKHAVDEHSWSICIKRLADSRPAKQTFWESLLHCLGEDTHHEQGGSTDNL